MKSTKDQSAVKAQMKAVGADIARARRSVGLSQTQLGELVGLGQSVISDWERGELASWQDYADALQRHIKWKPDDQARVLAPFMAGSAPAKPIEVIGEVQGGAFRMAVEYAVEDRYAVPIASVDGYEGLQLYALKVVGPSVNQLYPDGSHVIVVRAKDTEVIDGDRVVVYKRQGELCEATIKELHIEPDGKIGLYPRSDHPDFQSPIYLDPGDELSQDRPEIAFVVVGMFRQERRDPRRVAWVTL